MSSAANSRVAAIIPAAGSGERLGAAVPKAFVEIAGQSLLKRSAHAMALVADIVVVAAPADQLERATAELADVDAEVHVVAGGAQRQDSVAAGLAVIPQDVAFVLVHDAARPFVPQSVTQHVVDALRAGNEAVIPAVQVVDTIKRVNAEGTVVGTIDRTTLRRIQTPQGFARDVMNRAYADPTHMATDDSGLVEAMGVVVVTVPGDERAFKITTPTDLETAERLAGESHV